MTDKEFRRLSRADLIEIIYELQQSEKTLQLENEELKRKLADRQVAVSEAGSLAEVLAKLNGLFEAAQATADGYREEAEHLLEEARHTKSQADEYMSDVKRQTAKLAGLTMQQRMDLLAKTEEECRQSWAAAQKEASVPRQSSKDLELDAILRAAREDRCEDESQG